ncbi:CheF family chemotaxis protein [Halovenus marina]|uniref:CheF family chemotaxis protein n=1 Tax=Halovenus marina TaxID=3396621 RepID=UPI003F56D8BA
MEPQVELVEQMSESVIADFVAKFNSDRLNRADPIKGRVLLSEKRLVLAVNDNDKLTIPLSSIVDVAVGHIPEELSGFFDSTVTVGFERGDRQFVAVVEADDDTIGKFSNVLFRALLNGVGMTTKHPARVGGRVTNETFTPARLVLKPQRVLFNTPDRSVEISLSTVTEFSRATREIRGTKRPVLAVRHAPAGTSKLTLAAMDSSRKMSILGRYLRLEYSDLMAEIGELDLSKDEKEILVALYSGAGSEGISLAQIVNKEPAKLTMMLNDLEADELVVDTPDGTKLTPKGQVVVSTHLDDVNT